ncbi:adenosylcobinamide-GDP ribazoletransferase [Rhodobacteraceae bacterium RKSG542]|uniref:adenosylcobinamide-GDP ribazoletransferase n=1 Tax=Pseudovibrio flavus TaxID=2529854 RepID=UPI0012BB81C6|nr:adenosylcobinamide-GDP ribazoletransferase [Pseudovibrio flavus]MTI16987.1 adenosylcobinamide-GDP ribazoletransferase [Pseudovibrio flavus]
MKGKEHVDQENKPNGTRPLDYVKSIAIDLAANIRFFSRVPLPALVEGDDPQKAPDFTNQSRALPLCGLVVSFPAALILLALGASGLSANIVALLAVAASCAAMGFLHEDGFGDICDGFFGGHTKERRLEIMKDSRVGAFGAGGLILILTLRWQLIAALLVSLPLLPAVLVYLCAEMVSRLCLMGLWNKLGPAYTGGLGTRFGKPSTDALTFAGLSTLPLLILAGLYDGVTDPLVALVVSLVATFGLAKLAESKIGGFTGDVLGAAQQVGFVAFLIGWQLF